MPDSIHPIPLGGRLDACMLWAALEFSSPGIVLGLPDPFFGWESARRERGLADARERLLQAGYAGTDAPAWFSDSCADILRPRHAIFLTATASGRCSRRFAAFAGVEGGVFLSFLETAEYLLERLTTADELSARILACLPPLPISPAAGNSVCMPEPDFFRLHGSWKEQGEPAAAESSVDASAVQDILRRMRWNAAIAGIRDIGRPDVQCADGFGLIAGEGCAWILRRCIRGATPWTQIDPAGTDTVRAAVHALAA